MRKLIEDEILKATSHGELPDSISSVLTKSDYRQQVFNVCFERQLKYSSVVRLATRNEVKYYRLLVEYSEKHRRLFPYHLQVTFFIYSLFSPGLPYFIMWAIWR